MKRFIAVLMTVACLAGACTQAAAFEIPEAWIDQYRTEETFPADIAAEYYIQDGVLFFNDVLVAYPESKTDREYAVPEGIRYIDISLLLHQMSSFIREFTAFDMLYI